MESPALMGMLHQQLAWLTIACPEDLAHRIRSYDHSEEIGTDDRIFPINRKKAWQIAKNADEKAELQKRI